MFGAIRGVSVGQFGALLGPFEWNNRPKPTTRKNKEVIIWFKRLERTMLIKEPSALVQGLQKVKNTFFAGITGLIWYFDKETTPHIGRANDFVIASVTKGHYRFRLRNKVPKLDSYTFMADQS